MLLRLVNGVLYAVVLTIVVGIVIALLAPLLFPDSDPKKFGEGAGRVVGPITLLLGFAVGVLRNPRRKKLS